MERKDLSKGQLISPKKMSITEQLSLKSQSKTNHLILTHRGEIIPLPDCNFSTLTAYGSGALKAFDFYKTRRIGNNVLLKHHFLIWSYR